jgi:NAD+ diphosphatase
MGERRRTPIPLAGGTLDRAGERRTDRAWWDAALADPRALALDMATAEVGPLDAREPLALLGVRADDVPLFLLAGRPDYDLRATAAEADAAQQGLLAYAAHLSWFHLTHAFCGRCGAPTEPVDAGHARRCPNGHQHHPRTDPVVIMLVADGDERVLMGRQPAWPPGRYSALAGFVEPGESLESAVAREVREEANVAVGEVRYMASQPWPFPASLMLGFHAEWSGGEPAVGDAELEDVRWFSREEVAEAAREDVDWTLDDDRPAERLLLPPSLAIARHLLDEWLAGAR